MSTITRDELARLSLFAGLLPEQLDWIATHADVRDYENGSRLFESEEPAERMWVVAAGTVQLHYDLGGQHLLVATFTPGQTTGLLPFSRMTHYGVRATAGAPLRVLAFHRDQFPELLRVSSEIGQRLVAVMSDRVRETTKAQQQREKMISLGKLSAGLAHELNNPAAAVQRGAAALRERLARFPALSARLHEHDLDPSQLVDIAAKPVGAETAPPPAPTAIERATPEEAVTAWLEQHDVPEPWRLAATFAETGFDGVRLDSIAARVPAAALGGVLVWLEAYLDAARTLAEIAHAAGRISELVSSVKSYSHMDRGYDRQPTDVHAGLDNTLTMLGHDVNKKRIRLERRYDPALPRIEAFPGDLNQVWTNLLDNAFDAVAENGRVAIETARDGDTVEVRIIDDGPGIPPEVSARIFEPFFTTKASDEGTGLGLDIVQRIVRFHQGQVSVESKPGRTAFIVRLPITPAPAA